MKTLLNTKVDKEVKEEAKKLAEELGIPLSALVNAQLKQLIRSREVVLSAGPTPSPELEEFLGGVEREIAAGKRFSPTLKSAKALAEHLDG